MEEGEEDVHVVETEKKRSGEYLQANLLPGDPQHWSPCAPIQMKLPHGCVWVDQWVTSPWRYTGWLREGADREKTRWRQSDGHSMVLRQRTHSRRRATIVNVAPPCSPVSDTPSPVSAFVRSARNRFRGTDLSSLHLVYTCRQRRNTAQVLQLLEKHNLHRRKRERNKKRNEKIINKLLSPTVLAEKGPGFSVPSETAALSTATISYITDYDFLVSWDHLNLSGTDPLDAASPNVVIIYGLKSETLLQSILQPLLAQDPPASRLSSLSIVVAGWADDFLVIPPMVTQHEHATSAIRVAVRDLERLEGALGEPRKLVFRMLADH